MRVYRVSKDGFIESINTAGNYKPLGWYSTPEEARKHKDAAFKRWQRILNNIKEGKNKGGTK